MSSTAGPSSTDPMRTRRRERRSRRPRRRTRIIALVLLAVLVLGVGLALAALRLKDVQPEAEAARADLATAMQELSHKDTKDARAHIESARAHVDRAQSIAGGPAGWAWRFVPVAGGAVGDLRHLVDALDDATSIAEITLGVYPQVMGNASIAHGETIDLAKLSKIVDAVKALGPYVDGAVASLDAVRADTPVIGQRIADARTRAENQILPLASSYHRVAPALEQLPTVLGADKPMRILLAIMNPAELRYSGGATLTLAPVRIDHGTATFGKTSTVEGINHRGRFLHWRRVNGNNFHPRGGSLRLTAATFSPYWSVSGEELLRGWQRETGQRCQGLVALDLQALAQLFTVTGPLDVPGYGRLDAGNLVRTLAGSYDTFADTERRHQLNAAIIPAFRAKFFAGGRFLQKGRAIQTAARGRHFVTYFRDPILQRSYATLGSAGDLQATPNDYLGVFTQNLNGSKSDFWQHRRVDSRVKLAADGSADVHLKVTVDNQSPPYLGGVPDPHKGYFTRWLGTSLGVFLPSRTTLVSATDNGRTVAANLQPYDAGGTYPRPYFARNMLLAPQGTDVVVLHYKVENAATLDGQHLDYHLGLDPQGIVVPQATSVRVTLPAAYHWSNLPQGWRTAGLHTAQFRTEALTASTSYDVGATR